MNLPPYRSSTTYARDAIDLWSDKVALYYFYAYGSLYNIGGWHGINAVNTRLAYLEYDRATYGINTIDTYIGWSRTL